MREVAEAIATWWSRERPFDVETAWPSVTNLVWLGLERLLRAELCVPTVES